MSILTNIILVSTIAIVFTIILVIMYYRLKKTKTDNNLINDAENENNNDEIDELKSEIKRQNYILNDYRKKIGTKNKTEIRFTEEQINKAQKLGVKNVSDILNEKESFEIEKQKFKINNKKLWEQSIAIHKEKERIDKLRIEIEARHKEITDSIKYAKRIQTALLPSEKLIEENLNDYFILWKPRDIVSGDFYWLKQVDNKTILTAADCTGHGVPGAFMSMLGISFLNELVNNMEKLKASQILDMMRELVKTSLDQSGKKNESKDGMDMALCIIDHENNKMQFSGANNPLYIIRNNELIEIKATKNPIGIYLKEKPFENYDVELQKEDVLYIFSDGYVDQMGGKKGRKFMKRNFKELLLKMHSKNIEMKTAGEILDKTILDWMGTEHEQIDDILIIGVRIN